MKVDGKPNCTASVKKWEQRWATGMSTLREVILVLDAVLTGSHLEDFFQLWVLLSVVY